MTYCLQILMKIFFFMFLR